VGAAGGAAGGSTCPQAINVHANMSIHERTKLILTVLTDEQKTPRAPSRPQHKMSAQTP
jgi:hypothetical protein